MNRPNVKIIAVSNVFCRMMTFEKSGDVEIGHQHSYDHGTLVSSGEVLVEILDSADGVVSSKVFTAPGLIFIEKDKRHRLTATKDNTVLACIHAMRDINGDLLAPDFLIEEKWFADKWEDSDNINDHYHLYTLIKRNVKTKPMTV
jgi:quercetin dioxygenase-like cupin family protein